MLFPQRHSRRRLRPVRALTLALTLATLTGCSNSLPPAAEPFEARKALTTALDAWKQGVQPDALVTATPPLHVLDRDWSEGSTLVGYELVGDGYPLGHNVQQTVSLELKTPRGKAVKKTINYVINAGDPPVIARQDLDD